MPRTTPAFESVEPVGQRVTSGRAHAEPGLNVYGGLHEGMCAAVAQHLFGAAGAFFVHDLLRERHLLLLRCLTSAAIDLVGRASRAEIGFTERRSTENHISSGMPLKIAPPCTWPTL